jgi:hypothetical protein
MYEKKSLRRSLNKVTAVVLRVTLLDSNGGRAVYGVGLRPSACWNRGFESHGGHGCLSCTVFVLSGRGLYDGPIPRPEESCRLWCVLECDQTKSQKPWTPTVNK